MATQYARSKELIEEKKYDEAVEAATSALKESPTSPVYLITRALAYQRNKQYTEALTDAEAAVVYAHQRAKRELIIDAQVRRAIVLYNLERYGDARAIFAIVKRINKDVKAVTTWSGQIDFKVKTLGEDHEKLKVTVKEIPEIDVKSAKSSPPPTSTNGGITHTEGKHGYRPPPVQQTPVDKIRTDWYQNNQNVYLTILAKGVPKDKTSVDFTERSLTVSFPVETSNATYDYTLDPLFAAVIPDKCTTNILPSKVEIILCKATAGQKWAALESSEPVAESTTDENQTSSSAPAPAPKAPATTGPVYPTSSKHGPKNWDRVAEDVEDEKDGNEDAFFKALWKDASPDVRRAMQKSYTESNGTSLSTSWEQVSKGKVETHPPDGMEERKWGQ